MSESYVYWKDFGYWVFEKCFELRSIINRDDENIILFDPENSLKRMIHEPTIFVATHLSGEDGIHSHLAIQNVLSEFPTNNRRLIRSIGKDDNYLWKKNFRGRLENRIFNAIATMSGGMLISRTDSVHPKKDRPQPLFSIAATLNSGSHVFVYSTAALSVDGTVDFIKSPKHRLLSADYLRGVAQRVEGACVQTIHYTIDPVYSKFLVRMGRRLPLTPAIDFDFTKEIKECTTITILQLLSLYNSMKINAKEEQTAQTCKEQTAIDLTKIVTTLDRNYHIFNPHGNVTDAIDYVHQLNSGRRQPYKLGVGEGHTLILDTPDYQINQLKHLQLEHTISEILRGSK